MRNLSHASFKKHFTLSLILAGTIIFNLNAQCTPNCAPETVDIQGCNLAALQSSSGLAFTTTPTPISLAQFNDAGFNVTCAPFTALLGITYVDEQLPGSCPLKVMRTVSVSSRFSFPPIVVNFTQACAKTINIDDTAVPVIGTQASNMAVPCDGSGNVAQRMAWLNNNGGAVATDACGTSWTNNFTSLSDLCAATGAATVQFTVKDPCDNSANTSATFTVEDTTPPAINCPADITQPTDPNSTSATVNFAVTAPDACGTSTVSYSKEPGTVFPSGVTMVTATAVDQCGNMSTCTFNVTVADTSPPNAQCKNITVQLSNSGNATITASQVDNGSSDPSGVTLSVSPNMFNCSNAGPNTVTLTVTDGSGNMATCEATVTVLASIPPPLVSNQTVCNGQSAMIVATTGGANGSFNWYSDAMGNNIVHSGAVFNTPPLTSNTSYWVRETNGACMSSLVQVSILVTTIPSPASANATICTGQTATLNATTGGANGTFTWFSDSGAMNLVFTGPSFTTPALTANTSYWLRENGSQCSSALLKVDVIIAPQPEEPMLTAVTICASFQATLSASSGTVGGTYHWYSDAGGTQLVYTGINFTTPPLNATTNYWVKQVLGMCESALVQTTATVNPLPASPETNAPITVCQDSSATITATGGPGVFTWFSDPGGLNLLFTGNPYISNPLSNPTSFWVRVTDMNGCKSALSQAMVQIAPLLEEPTIFSVSICEGDTAVLTAMPSNPGWQVLWYSDALGANQVFMGNPYSVPGISANTSYWLRVFDGSCVSDLVKVDVIFYPQPANPSSPGATICSGNTATLQANSGNGGGGSFTWFADSAGTMTVSSSNPFTTNTLTTTTSYWLRETFNGCQSNLVEVIVNVSPTPPLPQATPDTICAGETAMLTAISPGGGSSFEWFGDASANNLLSTSNPYVINGLESSSSFWVREKLGLCPGPLFKTGVTVNAVPGIPIGIPAQICQGEQATLGAINTIGTVFWSSNMAGTDTLAMGNTYTTPPLNDTTTYFIREVSPAGCVSGTTSITSTLQPTPPPPAPANSSPACAGENVVLSALTVMNGIYQWTGPNNFSSTTQSPVITAAGLNRAGWYFVNVSVGNCTSITDSTQVIIHPLPNLDDGMISNTGPYCEGQTIQLQAPTIANVTYTWTYPDGTTSNLQNPQIPNASEADDQGFYTLQLTDNTTQCKSLIYSTLVMVFDVPQNIFALNDGPACEGESVQLNASSFINATYSWTGPNGFTSTLRNPILTNVVVANAGVYSVQITTSDGCVISELANTLVVIHPLPVIEAGPNQTIIQDNTAQLNASGGTSYKWTPINFLNNPDLPNPVASPPVGTHTYTVRGFNEFGCSSRDSLVIIVQPQTELSIMELFTPNNDGANDTWEVRYIENLNTYTLIVWDRGGYKLLETTSYTNNWDGTYKGKPIPDGTYWYSIRTPEKEYKGALTLIR